MSEPVIVIPRKTFNKLAEMIPYDGTRFVIPYCFSDRNLLVAPKGFDSLDPFIQMQCLELKRADIMHGKHRYVGWKIDAPMVIVENFR